MTKQHIFIMVLVVCLAMTLYVLVIKTSSPAVMRPTTHSFYCEFNKFFAVNLFKDQSPLTGSEFARGTAYIAVDNGKTTEKTQSLDGNVRGTNGTHWYQINDNDLNLQYISDDGDLITLHKKYQPIEIGVNIVSSLQSTSIYGFVYEGNCKVYKYAQKQR